MQRTLVKKLARVLMQLSVEVAASALSKTNQRSTLKEQMATC